MRTTIIYRATGLLAVLLCTAMPPVNAASPVAFELPALTQPASGEHHSGKVIWADLVTPDAEVSKRFYGALLGWSFKDVAGDPNYTLALLRDAPVAGLYHKAIDPSRPQQSTWLGFLAVRDVDRAGHIAEQHGGKVLSKPRSFARRGRQAVLADPDGAVFGVMAANGGDPPDYLAMPGEWIWSSLLVADTKREGAFYRALCSYQIDDLAEEGQGPAQHYVLSSGGYARAGLSALPADAVRRHPHWMNFVRVTDVAVTAQKAVSLGGRIILEPRVDRHGAMLAILADPSGAPFGIMEWSESGTDAAPKSAP